MTKRNNWRNLTQLDAPANSGFAVIPSSDDFDNFARALYIGVGGDVRLETTSGDILDFLNLPNGTVLPVRARKVLAAGTTATNIIGLY